jgi:hypothetical protein
MASLLTREVIGSVLVSLVFAVAAFIYFRIKKRRSLQEQSLPEPFAAKAGSQLFSCLYVASVFGSRPLERVWAYGLGIRGKADIQTSNEGLSIFRQGERDLLIPFSSIISLDRSSATIDRGVERDGLAQLRWMLGSTEIITSFRITQNQEANFSNLQHVVEEFK